MRDGRLITVEVTADGAGLVSHAGSALLARVADKLGLTRALSRELSGLRARRGGHHPGGFERLRSAHARARERAWRLLGAPGRLTIDLDATLIESHSAKEAPRRT